VRYGAGRFLFLGGNQGKSRKQKVESKNRREAGVVSISAFYFLLFWGLSTNCPNPCLRRDSWPERDGGDVEEAPK
jgi:hypothetical protein